MNSRFLPPLVTLLSGSAMWGCSLFTPIIEMPGYLGMSLAAAIALLGLAFALAGVISFKLAKTTINPHKPRKTSALVCSGVYRLTRNPMYVGLLLVLIAWAVFLASLWALLGVAAFVLYIGRFQIVPEERALTTLFGEDYLAYQARVRRWL